MDQQNPQEWCAGPVNPKLYLARALLQENGKEFDTDKYNAVVGGKVF